MARSYDEEAVREVSRMLGLRPRGTLAFLFDALAGDDLDFDGFLEHLERLLDHGFYLDEGIYLEAVRRARLRERHAQSLAVHGGDTGRKLYSTNYWRQLGWESTESLNAMTAPSRIAW